MDIFSMDWTDLNKVIALCKTMPGTIVIKYTGRLNYNITHASRSDLWQKPDVTVIYSENRNGSL
jgi:hypothetical protein